ncbi:MAG: hypothetical protein FJ319_07715 [SAR202 cluster bacterium]|nr:hypothetical protein [SAR202 cluster bacterium]
MAYFFVAFAIGISSLQQSGNSADLPAAEIQVAATAIVRSDQGLLVSLVRTPAAQITDSMAPLDLVRTTVSTVQGTVQPYANAGDGREGEIIPARLADSDDASRALCIVPNMADMWYAALARGAVHNLNGPFTAWTFAEIGRAGDAGADQ